LNAAQPIIKALDFSLLRVFAVDVTQCPRCGRSLRILSVITQPDVIEGILHHLDLPTAPPRPRAPRQPRLTCPGTMAACKTLGCCIEEGRLTQ
jgi:hypothetical protein